MSDENTDCPFIYSDGRKCCGHVAGWKVYGWRNGDPLHFAKKVRLRCSEKDDHAGGDRSFTAKERMEFYPDKLPAGLYAKIEETGPQS